MDEGRSTSGLPLSILQLSSFVGIPLNCNVCFERGRMVDGGWHWGVWGKIKPGFIIILQLSSLVGKSLPVRWFGEGRAGWIEIDKAGLFGRVV